MSVKLKYLEERRSLEPPWDTTSVEVENEVLTLKDYVKYLESVLSAEGDLPLVDGNAVVSSFCVKGKFELKYHSYVVRGDRLNSFPFFYIGDDD